MNYQPLERLSLLGPKYSYGTGEPAPQTVTTKLLLDFPARFLAVPLARERRFDTSLLTRLQVKRVPLHFFDNVFLLHFPLETPEGVFEGFALLESNFRQSANTSHPTKNFLHFAGRVLIS
jgi:hypothetical protein